MVQGIDRIGIWSANVFFFVLCCYLVAGMLNRVVTGLFVDSAPEALEASTLEPALQRSWEDRQIILEANLFNSSFLAPALPEAEPEPIEEELEETRLPLNLLGTAAASNPELSWAAVEDLEQHLHVVVRVGDILKETAKVLRIEPRRIVLKNGSHLEELALKEDESNPRAQIISHPRPTFSRPQTNAVAPRSPEAVQTRVRRLAEDRFAVNRQDVESTLRNPAQLFSQARILPRYQDGRMVGVQLNNIRAGSVFESIGVQDGDVITELNGIAIDSPEQSAVLMRELSQAKELSVSVLGADGTQRTLSFVPED